jgi:hypothetical protein
MLSYTKNVAVIKTLRQGFSSDGNELSGLVRVEKYGKHFEAHLSLVNFAPLSEGRLVFGITDGSKCEIFEKADFVCESELDPSAGFGALVCFVHKSVLAIASAVCGNKKEGLPLLLTEIERREGAQEVRYEDEAIAEENYYEYDQTFQERNALRPYPQKEQKDGQTGGKNEESFSDSQEAQIENGQEGDFFSAAQKKAENLLANYERMDELSRLIHGSKWVKIPYGEGKHYAFGVLVREGKSTCFCYGVAGQKDVMPPSFEGVGTFVPISNEYGYWVLFQDGKTGKVIEVGKA